MTITTIALEHLRVSPHNVRKSFTKSGIDEMKASILAHGLLDNLIVTEADDGMYHVVGGGRRLVAMQALQKEGSLPKGHAIPCKVVEPANASELSLAENTVREEMHPADEFEAFATLAKALKPEEIGIRFGVTTKHVQQRMRLARVAPELMKAYRAGDMDLDALMAFTLSDDHNHQRKVFKATGKKPPVHYVRRLMTEKTESSTGKLCKFVTLKAYVAAGGKVREDLFGTETFLENPELLHQLANDKLATVCEKLKAEGWGWVETALESEYGFTQKYARLEAKPTDAPKKLTDKLKKLQADYDKADTACSDADYEDEDLEAKRDELQAQLTDLEPELEAYNKFDPEEMKVAGAYARLDYDGKLEITRGLVARAEQKRLDKTAGKAAAKQEEKGLSQSLRMSLEAHRLQIAEVAVASKPDLAYDLLVFKAATSLLGDTYGGSGIDIKWFDKTPMTGEVKNSPAAKALAAIKEKLSLDWFDEDEGQPQFDTFRKLPAAQKASILAYCVALMLEPDLAPTIDSDVSAYDATLALTGVDVSSYWRPTADNYLSRITRDQLLDIGGEIFSKTWAETWGSAKKGDMVKELDRAFADPKKFSGNKETEQKLRTWLPEGMSFVLPEKKPAKSKKKAA